MLSSVGDRVPPGAYSVHSKFERAVNFLAPGRLLVSVVDQSVGPGPLNIVVRGVPVSSIDRLSARADEVSLNGRGWPVSDRVLYCSALPGPFAPTALRAHLPALRSLLAARAPERSLAFLFDPDRREREFRSGFDRALAGRLAHGHALLMAGHPVEAARALRGLGHGLTPSGDDYVCGMLIALRLAHGERPASLVLEAALGENPISNAMLRMSAEGRVTARVRRLLEALGQPAQRAWPGAVGPGSEIGLTSGDRRPGGPEVSAAAAPPELAAALDPVLAAGATSGADLAAGLAATLQACLSPEE